MASAVGLALLATALTAYGQDRPPGPSPGGSSGGSACYTATAACDNNVLPANGWWISERRGRNGCIWKKYKNPLASNEGYNRDEINRRWKTEWYQKFKVEAGKVFSTRLKVLRDLTAKGVRVSWWYNVVVDRTGTVKDVVFLEQASDYNPKEPGRYSSASFREDSDQWIKLLKRMKAPAFPQGSVNDEATMPVNFTNEGSGTVDVPDKMIPQEDERKKEAKGEVKC